MSILMSLFCALNIHIQKQYKKKWDFPINLIFPNLNVKWCCNFFTILAPAATSHCCTDKCSSVLLWWIGLCSKSLSTGHEDRSQYNGWWVDICSFQTSWRQSWWESWTFWTKRTGSLSPATNTLHWLSTANIKSISDWRSGLSATLPFHYVSYSLPLPLSFPSPKHCAIILFLCALSSFVTPGSSVTAQCSCHCGLFHCLSACYSTFVNNAQSHSLALSLSLSLLFACCLYLRKHEILLAM